MTTANKSFQTSLRRSILIPAGFLGILAILLLFQLWRMNNASQWVLHTDEVIDRANQLQTALLDMETGMRGYELAGRIKYLEPYETSKPKLSPLLTSLEGLASTKPEQIERVKALRLGIGNWTQYVEQKIVLRKNKTSILKSQLFEDNSGKTMMDDLRSQLSEIILVERNIFQQRTETFAIAQKTLILFILFSTASSGLESSTFTRIRSARYQSKKLTSTSPVKI